jgi:phosphate:Na+ symporter
MIHLYFNLLGTLVFMVAFYGINALVGGFAFLRHPANAAGIAALHSLFNVGAVILFYPFADRLVYLAELTIPDRGREAEKSAQSLLHLDERFLESPSFAMERCRSAACEMARQARDCLFLALTNLTGYSDENVQAIAAMEARTDACEDAIGTYLVKLNNCDLSQEDSHTLSVLLHCIGDFERIADHAANITEDAGRMHEEGLSFSLKATEEINVFSGALKEIAGQTISAFVDADLAQAERIEAFEQVIDRLSLEMKQRHIRRVRSGDCTIELGFLLEDMITNFERVSDHCSNIAVCMLRVSEDEFDTHGYLGSVREEHAPWFEEEYRTLLQKYALPAQKS